MIHVITLGFTPSRIWAKSCAAFYQLKNPELEVKHWFLDQKYPINEEQNSKENLEINAKHNIITHSFGQNVGAREGFNRLLALINPSAEDIVVGYDPDSLPISPGFLGALCVPLWADKSIVWTSLNSRWSTDQLTPDRRVEFSVAGVELWQTRYAVMNSICAWNAEWLKSIGGIVQHHQYYGGLEVHMFEKLGGRKWCFTKGFYEDSVLRNQQDRAYAVWKWRYAHERIIHDDFKTWLTKQTFNSDGSLVGDNIPNPQY